LTDLTPTTAENAARYSYYTADIVSNKILTQIPFEDVSYERILKGGGSFDGKISISSETGKLDLYNGTLPGKTALYVVRNDVCVWGGIIWGRTYDMAGRSLSVTAQEFPSYFAHRNVWKTFNYSFTATAEKTAAKGLTKIVLTDRKLRKPLPVTDSAGVPTKVYVSFSDGDLVKYSGSYPIEARTSDEQPTQNSFSLRIPKLPKSPNPREGVTVSARVDTFEYIRELLNDVSIDFADVDFQNEVIAPGVRTNNRITYRACSSNTVTITTEDPHYMVPGQYIEIKNLEKELNGKFKITETPTPYEFKYFIPVLPIKTVARDESDLGTVTVHVPDGGTVKIKEGATVVLSGCTNTTFNVTAQVLDVTSDSISFASVGDTLLQTADTTGYVTVPNYTKNTEELNPTNYRVNFREISTTGKVNVTKILRVKGVVVVTTKTRHGFKKGDKVVMKINDTGDPGGDGTFDSFDTYKKDSPTPPLLATGSKWFKFYDDKYKENKQDIYSGPANDKKAFTLRSGKKNTVALATPIRKRVLRTADTSGFEDGDYLQIMGVDEYDWKTPIYNGYAEIESLNAETATITHRQRYLEGGISYAKYETDDDHGFDIGDRVVITDMSPATFNGEFLIRAVTDRSFEVASAGDPAGRAEDGGTAVTYGSGWMQFEMPEYSVTKEPNNSVSLTRKWYKPSTKTVTIQTSVGHGFRRGDVVKIAASGSDKIDDHFTGTFTVTSTPSSDLLKYKVNPSPNPPAAKDVAASGSVTRVKASTASYPIDKRVVSRVMRKNNTATIISLDHDLTDQTPITLDMSNSGQQSFESPTGKPEKISVPEENSNLFTYPNTGDDVGKSRVTRYSQVKNTGIVTITTFSAHGYAVGQAVEISGISTNITHANLLNRTNHVIKAVPTATTFTFDIEKIKNNKGSLVPQFLAGSSKDFNTGAAGTDNASPNAVSYSTVAAGADSAAYVNYELFGSTREVISIAANATTKTVTLGVPEHNYRVGDYAQMTLYGKTYQTYVYTTTDAKGALSPNLPVMLTSVSEDTVSYVLPANHTYYATLADLALVQDENGLGEIGLAAQIERTPVVVSRSYGEFPDNADMGGFDFSNTNYSDLQIQNSVLRGSDMTNVAQILEGYSNNSNGFDYRIDCSLTYDSLGNKMFKRTFVLIPITPVTYKDYLDGLPDKKLPVGTYAPASAFGADKLLFEFPGNVSNFNLSENSSNAATRVFVVGNNDDTGGAASARYSAASATNLLADGWPLLDKSEAQEWPLTGVNAINVDNWGNYDAELDFSVTAERFLNESRPPLGDFIVSVNGSLNPVVGTYNPGDWCSLVVNDDFFRNRMSSILEPRKDVVVRKIDGVKVSVPNSPAFPEQIDLTLITEWQVDAIGK
jgi:hypothetical protein